MGKPLWDAQVQGEYLRQRDEAIERRVDQREGTTVAREFDANWAQLPAEERQVLEFLVLSRTRSCIGHCADPTLVRLVERGMLSWPPGVRPVLTDDLVSVFTVAPALWAVLAARRSTLLAAGEDEALRLHRSQVQFEGRLTPLASVDASEPGAPVG
ncbi:MAG: hypothetical protein IPL06_16195 [Betaproteobacteria bacterium]|nr:hypothetical protein [Betaproteobacteria bacterium]